MNQNISQIALMYVLPLGITFITILQSAAAEYRNHKIVGALISLVIVALDCLFYFNKNSIVTYNTDGGLLLAFTSLFFFGVFYIIKSEDVPGKVAHGIFCALMLTAFIGIAYWERPTLLVVADTQSYADANARYQDYISSFQNGEGGKWQQAPKAKKQNRVAAADQVAAGEENEEASSAGVVSSKYVRYVDEANKVIARMESIMESIDNYEPIAPNISEEEREKRGSQALAINNNAIAINKKALGLFHPHETSEIHTELIQASENLRLAAYSLYTYSLQEDTEEQMSQYKQARSQIAQTKIYLDRFKTGVQKQLSNNKQQTEE